VIAAIVPSIKFSIPIIGARQVIVEKHHEMHADSPGGRCVLAREAAETRTIARSVNLRDQAKFRGDCPASLGMTASRVLPEPGAQSCARA
jgi:hypothetical protein